MLRFVAAGRARGWAGRARSGPGHFLAVAVLLLAALTVLPVAAWGQYGGVRGRVVEAGTGIPLVGATVRLTGPAAAAVVTGEGGAWRTGSLPPGRYRIRVEHLGHAAREVAIEIERRAAPAVVTLALTPRPVSLDALVVTASRRLQRLKDVPVATELITRRDLRRTGASDLSAVLTERTGIALEGGHPAGAGVMIQGLGSERVLVLVDGQPYIGRISGQIDLSRIPTSMIERVEVVKGPQSTLYGSDAMGGVVNVITREAAQDVWTGGAAMTAGSNGRLDAAAHALGNLGPVSYVADAGHRAVRLVPGMDGETGARAERWDALAKLRWHATPTLSLETGILALDERQRWQNGQLYQFADNREWSARLGAQWESGRHHLAPMLYATEFSHLSRRAAAPEPVAGTGEREVQRLAEGEVLYGVDLGAHALDAGIEVQQEEVRSDRVAGHDRSLFSAETFAQLTLSGERWALVPGIRLSTSERWGSHWTPRVAALYRPLPLLALRISAGQGYRAPAFKELYMEFLNIGPGFGYTVRGNPELHPETSRNITAGVEWAGQRLYLRGQLFYNRFEDFIETRAAGDSSGITVFTYGNIAAGTTRGAELEAGASWRGVELEAGYTHLMARQSGSGEPLLGRPEHSGRLSLSYALPVGLRAGISGTYTGSTPSRRTEVGTVEREAFTRFDTRLAQRLPYGFELALGADNLFDARPGDWPGFTGRRFYARVAWRGGQDAAQE